MKTFELEATTIAAGSPADVRQRSTLLHPSFIVPMSILVPMLLLAAFGRYIVPHDPESVRLIDHFLPPVWIEGGSPDHLLGTDALGRDMLSRLIVGAQASVMVALAAILLAGSIGTLLGMTAGFFGGWVDAFIMRLVDAAFAFPTVFLALLLAAVFGAGLMNLVIVIALILWSRFARLIRGEVLSARELDFVALARTAGASNARIMLRHILPTILNTVVVVCTLQVGVVILVESALSFLGVGVPPPTPAWGSMLAGGRDDLARAWWVSLFPGIAIMLTVMSVNMLGDFLRDVLDPRLRQAR